MTWINLLLDVVLIGLVAAGLVQAGRLISHLSGLKQGRLEMERFVREFNTTVLRAEAGIKGLRAAARDSGDDLEKLVEKAVLLRDELQFIVESADQIAGRLSESATTAVRPVEKTIEKIPEPKPVPAQKETVTLFTAKKPVETLNASQASRAEQELMQDLEKLG